jgi:prophage tail gpP-like protein
MSNNGLSPIDAKNRVTLEVDGVKYWGWKDIKIRHAIDQLAGTFNLALHDRWDGQVTQWGIEPGAAAVVKIGEDVMITGYVDESSDEQDSKSHALHVAGRDRAGDLVDCSAPPKEWAGLPFEHIAVELCEPYKIDVWTQLDTDGGAYKPKQTKDKKGKITVSKAGKGGSTLPKKATNTGETVHKLLEKLCKIQGCLLISDRVGGIIITRGGLGGAAHDKLEVGKNILKISRKRSFANLFSQITVKGQSQGSQTAARTSLSNVSQTVKPVATVKRVVAGINQTLNTQAINRYRPLILAAEEQADTARCARRAAWEAGTREAKSLAVSIKVQGWRQSNGEIWAINQSVYVAHPKINAALVISAAEFSLDVSGGMVTDLTLCPKAAFDVLPEIPAPVGKGGAGNPNTLSSVRGQQPSAAGIRNPSGRGAR